MQIPTLPPEILLQVFSALDITHLFSLKQTSKQFKDLSTHSRHVVWFAVDAPGHPTWKLLKYLLQDQEAGKQIVDIQVEWHRRGYAENDWIRREQWVWTDCEIQAIKRIGRGGACFLTECCETAVLGGINSEALLPLLLVLCPNLRSLDLGAVNGQLITNDIFNNLIQIDVLDTFLKLFNDENRRRHYLPKSAAVWLKQEGYEQLSLFIAAGKGSERARTHFGVFCRTSYERFAGKHLPPDEMRKTGSLWLQHTILYGSKELPGMRSLKHFKCSTKSLSSNTDAAHYRILSYPSVETVWISGCFATQGIALSRWRWDNTIHYNDAKLPLITKCPSLRRLEFLQAHVTDEDLEVLANMTTNLGYLAIERATPPYPRPELSLERIGDLFLRNNQNLTVSGIIIMDYTSKVFGDGDFGGVYWPI